MSVQPGTYNITLQRRADYSLLLQFKDSDDDAIDLTGYTAYAQVWNEGRTTKYADFAIAYTCLLYTSPSPRDLSTSRMPSSA